METVRNPETYIMGKPTFSNKGPSDFSRTLRKRIKRHFKDSGTDRHANNSMRWKTVLMLFLFLAPLIILNTGLIAQIWPVFMLYIISGLGMAGIGMGIMHDAIHGSYSRNRTVNRYLGYTMNLIGANAAVWRIQHNVLHHTYPNVQEADDDINMPFFLRFSPHAKKYRIHRFQYLYVWFFYSMSTIAWVTAKDFVRLYRYKKMGFLGKKGEFRNTLMKLIAWKSLYYLYSLILPIIVLPMAPWIVVSGFIAMHLVTGLLISSVFQIAHIMPGMEYPLADKNGTIDNDWAAHQLATTSNFSPDSRLFSWLIGGLNYQVEHHLFPNICHVHYRKISPIVKRTAKEFGIPYHTNRTFLSAIMEHIKMLRSLGTAKMAVQGNPG
ncbi:linoleoyl-CoA desaturase [Pricia antarctica]|uniref:Linoleoyl-CoA desaturase n=1 Tax=Pricia antarctica TaxID=641691 RepID=A0A1G6VNM1_9FLAO|nr:acyl-CoA desaturase [Pricia antarctica]SDD55013.1 linoleoyl-CoA desaturase [Pricia antarctica]